MTKCLEVDAVVVGAGLGGIYAVHKLREMGLNVVGLERASGVGGVWRHNGYPGSRVDLPSYVYSYHFSPEIYREWRWSEHYSAQPELLRYLEFVADRLSVTEHFRFNTPMLSAEWRPKIARYHVRAGGDLEISTRFLVMATGNLSYPRDVPFPGAERFRGDIAISSRWPEREIQFEGRRVAVVGTGSSGVQSASALAGKASHLYVFQRTPHYCVPSRNGPMNVEQYEAVAADSLAHRATLWRSSRWKRLSNVTPKRALECTREEQLERLERQWRLGGHGIQVVFTDQLADTRANEVVAEFVRNKIRETVKDPAIAEKLIPSYPIGIKRISIDDGYYEIFNRPDVSLVDMVNDPIQEFTETGIRTRDREYEVDVIILALGFKAFRGELDAANIRNEHGLPYTNRWDRGPQTLLGLMTAGFPNLFVLTGPGSPSVQANLFLQNEYHVEWLVKCFEYMAAHGHETIEPGLEAQERWSDLVTQNANEAVPIRVLNNNYLVHVNDDGTRAFIPYVGFDKYIEIADRVAANGYEGFKFEAAPAQAGSARMLSSV